MSSHDDDDLFGDGDSGGSLFGNDDDSLFDGPDDDQEEQTTTSCCSSKTESCWTHFRTTHASHDHGDQADHEDQAETVHQSPGPSPSKDGMMQDLERMLEQEFAQDQNSVDRLGQIQVPSPAIQPSAQPTDDTQMLMEYNILRDQAARSTTTSLGDQPAGIGIGLAAAEFRWADATSRRGIRLPRRIDFDGVDVNVLTPYLTLNRGDSATLHYERLELSEKSGKLLLRDLKEYVMLSPDVQHLKQRGRLDTDKRRVMFLTAALRLLRNEGWGAKWFGPASPTGSARTLVWPADSTLIVMRFTGLLYKVADQAKYRKPQNGRQQSTESRQTLEGHSQASPIDLTNDDNGNTAVIRGLTPNTSVCSRRPASSHMSASQASNGAMFLGNQDSAITSRRPSLALPAYRSPAFHGAGTKSAADFYIMEDSTSQAESSGPNQTSNSQGENTPPTGITLATLAEQVADLKQQKQKPPEMRPVKYRLTFTDTRDAQDLRPPIVGVLGDDIVKGDKVVETIRSAFSRASMPATIFIETSDGPVEVTTQDDWNEAVHNVWRQHGDGAVVHVAIHV